MKDQEVQPGGRKWARVGCLGLAALVGLFVVIGEFGPKPEKSPAQPDASEPSAAELVISTLREQGAMGDYALTIPAGFAPDALLGIAKEQCGARSHCSVYGWTDAAQTARALPLTDPEFENLAFRYDLNRSTGFERSLWDCKRFPQPDKASCL